MHTRFIVLVVTLSLFAACQPRSEPPVTETQATETQPPEPTALTEGFQTPESVLYDADQDVYFISNINGKPTDADDNGYISRVNAETMEVESKWIDGATPEVMLSAPKGMAIVGDDLLVTDITTIRKFDPRTGAPKGEVKIPKSTFMNDLASDGAIAYASDSGMKPDFSPSGTDAIWKIEGDKATKLASGKDLKGPNGLAVAGGKVWAVTFGANELYAIENGKKTNVTTMPKGQLDGLVVLPDGSLLISSWEAKSVWRGKPGQTFASVVDNVESPADIGFDTKRNRLLIPHFNESRVTIHKLQ